MTVYVIAEGHRIFDEFDSNPAVIYGVYSDKGTAETWAKHHEADVYEFELDVNQTEYL